ncbi:MAG: HpaII family restriction endonuclease [Akkermansiaceae bacterium]|nr:HpaII family restriction endonuclease [Akkermansiaceae bacterium]
MNKGEWSEAYVFLHLLGEPFLEPCDENLEKNPWGLRLPVSVIRRGEHVVCTWLEDSRRWLVEGGGLGDVVVDASEGGKAAEALLCFLLSDRFRLESPCPPAEEFLKRLGVPVKARSKEKKDITLTLRDIRSGSRRSVTCGFSIKSYLGGPPTLFNAGGDSTNLLYRVEGLAAADEPPERLNGAGKIGRRISNIREKGGRLVFEKMCGEVFEANLKYVDTRMPQILGELLLISYSMAGGASVQRAAELLAEQDPLKLGKGSEVYGYKIRKMLEAVSLGMTPSTPWKGTENANGGFIIVKKDGEIVSYHLYDRPAFLDYIFHSTYFEHPSRERHRYGSFRREGETLRVKLALQIRFNPL